MTERHGALFMSLESRCNGACFLCISTYSVNNTYPHLLLLCQYHASRIYVCQPKTICSTETQWSTVVARLFFLQILTIAIPWLAHEGGAWGVVYKLDRWPSCLMHNLWSSRTWVQCRSVLAWSKRTTEGASFCWIQMGTPLQGSPLRQWCRWNSTQHQTWRSTVSGDFMACQLTTLSLFNTDLIRYADKVC